MEEPGVVAYAVLVAWIPVSLAFFFLRRPLVAAAVTLLGSVLLLPARVAFNLTGFPDLGREKIGILCALLGCILFHPRRLQGQRLGRGWDLLVFMLVLGAVATALTNSDPVSYGPLHLPGLTLYDALSDGIEQLLALGTPFFLGRALASRPRDLKPLLAVLAGAGLLYSLPILYEVRMSPQLHRMIYGYFQHTFAQVSRLGGWRPMVFMNHGLALALFVLSAAMAAVTLARVRHLVLRLPSWPVAGYLGGILLLCRSLGAIAYGFFTIPLAALGSPRVQLRSAIVIAAVVLLYPVMRASDVFPTHAMTEIGSRIDEARGDSLQFRFDNEDRLLAKARERIWFGWGGWGRNFVYHEESGENLSVIDGYWIIRLGTRGVVGFVGAFGLLLAPILSIARRMRTTRSSTDRLLLGGAGLVAAVTAVDLIPNGFLNCFQVFFAGAVVGAARPVAAPTRSERRQRPAPEKTHRPAQNDGQVAGGRLYSMIRLLPLRRPRDTAKRSTPQAPANLPSTHAVA